MKPLRLLVAALDWPPETFLAQLISGLLDAGVEVTVACRTLPSRSWRERRNFKWFYAPSWEGPAARRLAQVSALAVGAGARSVLEVGRLVQSSDDMGASWWNRMLPFVGRRWDVVYLPWNGSAAYYDRLFDLGMPVVVGCRGSQVNVSPHDPNRAHRVEAIAEVFEKAAAVHCVSKQICDEAALLGLRREKAAIIRPAVDTDVFSPGGSRHEGPFRVMTTGSLVWKKGHEYALQGIRELLERGISMEYDIIGEGLDLQRIEYGIDDMALSEHVSLHGRLSPAAVRDLLRSADAFLLMSVTEGISNAVLEAMACALPVVVTNAGGMREAVRDGIDGFVIPVRDVQAAGDALERLAKNVVLRRSMGRAGREHVVANFSVREHVNAFVDLFHRVAA